MVYPAGIALTQFRFSLQDSGTEDDIAEFGIHWQTATAAPPADWDAWLAELAEAAYASWVAHALNAQYRTNVVLSNVTARGYDTSLHTLAEQIYSAGTLWHGTGTDTCMPWQVSYVVGLYGYAPGGFAVDSRNKRGRIYLPPMQASSIDNPATAEIELETATAYVAQIDGLIGGIQDSGLSPNAIPKVLSRTKQAVTTVGWLRGQTVFDTQRRRMHQLPRATYSQLLA